MTFALQPNLIGVIADLTKDRLRIIEKVAAYHSVDLASMNALQRRLIAEDLGNPSACEISRVHQVCSAAVSTYQDWLRTGRRLVTLDNIDDYDLTNGTHYFRLDDFPTISLSAGQSLSLEGAFVSSKRKPVVKSDYAVTVLLSGDPGPRLAEMNLRELIQHQSNIVMTTWDADNQMPMIVVCGQPEIENCPAILAGVEKVWELLANRFEYGRCAPESSPPKLC